MPGPDDECAGTGGREPRARDRWARYRLGPVVVDAIRKRELVDELVARASGRGRFATAYVNAHVFEQLHRDPDLARVMSAMDAVFCDGVGALLGFRLLGASLPERMTPPDFIDEILAGVYEKSVTVFLLGDEEEVVAKMAERTNARWPGVVTGHHHGFFAEAELGRVADQVKASGASLVLVAMGTPRQEKTIALLRASGLPQSMLAVGGLFRWCSGTEKRGPRWATDHGFEWLFRLLAQPRRTAHRYLLGLPKFALRIARYRFCGAEVMRLKNP